MFFKPVYTVTSKIAENLVRAEELRERILTLPLESREEGLLRETARLMTMHYSTMIEGNRLSLSEVEAVLRGEHFPGRERDEKEVKGYYAALALATKGAAVTENMVKQLHALVMGGGKLKCKPTPYRDGQNVIRDAQTKRIVYMPPEAKDVPGLMADLIAWVRKNKEISCPIVASVVHYQYATIHPYYDGNGRTARLLTTLILHLGGYDLKGLYSLEEYYARNLGAYYEAISVGPSHNYYMGRAEADMTKWVEYFIDGLTDAFEKTFQRMQEQESVPDQSEQLRKLDARQRKVLELFAEFETITSSQIGKLFGYKPRTSSQLCHNWVEAGFFEIVDFSNKNRKYKLANEFQNFRQLHPKMGVVGEMKNISYWK